MNHDMCNILNYLTKLVYRIREIYHENGKLIMSRCWERVGILCLDVGIRTSRDIARRLEETRMKIS